MGEKSLGNTIEVFRREKNLTQAELASLVGVTEAEISQWELGLSYPAEELLSRLSEILGVTIDELMWANGEAAKPEKSELRDVMHLVCKAIALAMGIGVTVLSILGKIEVKSAITMLGLGLTALAMTSFVGKHKND